MYYRALKIIKIEWLYPEVGHKRTHASNMLSLENWFSGTKRIQLCKHLSSSCSILSIDATICFLWYWFQVNLVIPDQLKKIHPYQNGTLSLPLSIINSEMGHWQEKDKATGLLNIGLQGVFMTSSFPNFHWAEGLLFSSFGQAGNKSLWGKHLEFIFWEDDEVESEHSN